MDEWKHGELLAGIVRAADFHGPRAAHRFNHASVFERIKAGKAAQWMGDPRTFHTFTLTSDAARTVAFLGNTPEAYGRVWHALSSRDPLTSEGSVRLTCELAGRPFKRQVARRWMLGLMGLFVPVLQESLEMLYPFEHDHRFDSGRLERAFQLQATGCRDAIAATLKA